MDGWRKGRREGGRERGRWREGDGEGQGERGNGGVRYRVNSYRNTLYYKTVRAGIEMVDQRLLVGLR